MLDVNWIYGRWTDRFGFSEGRCLHELEPFIYRSRSTLTQTMKLYPLGSRSTLRSIAPSKFGTGASRSAPRKSSV